ncbi:MAG: hypothetical protein DI602_08435 [Aliarcobacter butzleri]|nr:MAG: hypothetical protein DI602_08435 [Aliarcobacter butzleri]
MILKVLGLVIVGFVIYFIFFKKSRQNDIAKKDKMITDDMIECESCKTYVSLKEAILSNGKYYCSKDCLNK